MVSYTMKEVVEQINRKLDVLPTLVSQVTTVERAQVGLDKRVVVLETDVSTLKDHDARMSTVSLFKDKVWAKILGIAGAAGAVAGTVAATISVFT